MGLSVFKFRNDCVDRYSAAHNLPRAETIHLFKKAGIYWSLVIDQKYYQHNGNWETFMREIDAKIQ
jgi:hypothetical protein